MFRIYYAGKRSVPQTNPERTERTEHGWKICDLMMGLEFFTERGHTLDLDETHTYICTTDLDDPETIFQSYQGEFASRDFCDMIRESDATHTSMSVGDVLVEVSTGRVLFCDRFGFTEVN